MLALLGEIIVVQQVPLIVLAQKSGVSASQSGSLDDDKWQENKAGKVVGSVSTWDKGGLAQMGELNSGIRLGLTTYNCILEQINSLRTSFINTIL